MSLLNFTKSTNSKSSKIAKEVAELIVLSYNVNFGLMLHESSKESEAAQSVIQAVSRHSPDFVCLQV